jgi:hypothetical protein
MGNSESQSSSSDVSNFKDHFDALRNLSSSLKQGQTFAMFGEEVDQEDNNTKRNNFNFWLCRVEEKAPVSILNEKTNELEKAEDSHISCYGSHTKSGIFYFWLLRDFYYQREQEGEKGAETNSSKGSQYNFRRPSEEEVKAFSTAAIAHLQEHNSHDMGRRGTWKTVVPLRMWRRDVENTSSPLLPGFHVFENSEEQDKFQLYGRKIMQDFMMK